MHSQFAKLISRLFATYILLSFVTAAYAQNKDQEASELVQKAMDEYSKLELNSAKEQLESALELSKDLSKSSLANVCISLGVVWIGGFTDNEKGQDFFQKAICLDSGVKVDPLYSTPEIDMIFRIARTQAKPAACSDILAAFGISATPVGDESPIPIIPEPEEPLPPEEGISCGSHNPIKDQKTKFEVPIYVEVSPEMAPQISKVVVHYAFDSALVYEKLNMSPMEDGYGAMLDCDNAKIRIYDPATITYYVEGLDANGRVVCNEGSENSPFEVLMESDATPVESVAGMTPKECQPCPPWDETCGKSTYQPGLGKACQPDVGCREGLVCGDLGVCEEDTSSKGKMPKKFYTNLTFGTGFGFFTKEMSIKQFDEDDDPSYYLLDDDGNIISSYDAETNGDRGAITNVKDTPEGTGWNGLPLRLAIGFNILPNLSIELSGRVDLYMTTIAEPVSCWEYDEGWYDYGDDNEGLLCSADPDETRDEQGRTDRVRIDELGLSLASGKSYDEEFGDRVVTLDNNDKHIESTSYQVAWLINARVKYLFFTKGGLALSFFGGLGYGHIKYRIDSKNKENDNVYFPMPGVFDIELGLGLAYYFTKNFGFIVELPIDAVMGDGFALNTDLTVGIGVGF